MTAWCFFSASASCISTSLKMTSFLSNSFRNPPLCPIWHALHSTPEVNVQLMASTEVWIQRVEETWRPGRWILANILTTLLFSFPHPLTHNTSLGFKSSNQVKYLARVCGLDTIFQLFVRLPSFAFVSRIQTDIPSTSPPFYLTHTHNKIPLQITPECVHLFTHYALFTWIQTECNASQSNAIIRLNIGNMSSSEQMAREVRETDSTSHH